MIYSECATLYKYVLNNSRVFRQRFANNIIYPFKLISNCIEKCGSSDTTESGSSVLDTILIMLSQTTAGPCGRCIKTVDWSQYILHANNTDTYRIYNKQTYIVSIKLLPKHKIVTQGSQKLSFVIGTDMACGNAL